MSFDMHGFNQGVHTVRDMIFSDKIVARAFVNCIQPVWI